MANRSRVLSERAKEMVELVTMMVERFPEDLEMVKILEGRMLRDCATSSRDSVVSTWPLLETVPDDYLIVDHQLMKLIQPSRKNVYVLTMT